MLVDLGDLLVGDGLNLLFTAALVVVKIVALTVFIVLALPAVQSVNFEPMLPNGWPSSRRSRYPPGPRWSAR